MTRVATAIARGATRYRPAGISSDPTASDAPSAAHHGPDPRGSSRSAASMEASRTGTWLAAVIPTSSAAACGRPRVSTTVVTAMTVGTQNGAPARP